MTATAPARPTDYLASNRTYWEKGYSAPNVDHNVFRFYGRVLVPDFGITGAKSERLIDFGCGQAASVNFWVSRGFNARGVDISETDIGIAKIRYPQIAERLAVVDPKPANNRVYGFDRDVDVVVALQSLYYFDDTDFAVVMDKLYSAMKPGGVFYATMLGEQASEFFDNSEPAENGLRVINFKNDRLDVRNYYAFFVKDRADLTKRFRMFKPRHIGYYSAKFREDEGDGFHWTFVGVKE